MKSFLLFLCTLLLVVFTSTESKAQQHFEPTWGSLAKNPLPEWVKDAKFGVYTHWGIYSVPAHGGPDYIRNLYEGSRTDAKGVSS